LAGQGLDVVCATVSMFHDVRRWSRAHIPAYREIYLRAPIPLLMQRHPKGLYSAAVAGRIRNVPGVDQDFEAPEAPDLIIDDDGSKSPEAVAAELFRFLQLEEAFA
jgi:adenylylsulfate kinase